MVIGEAFLRKAEKSTEEYWRYCVSTSHVFEYFHWIHKNGFIAIITNTNTSIAGERQARVDIWNVGYLPVLLQQVYLGHWWNWQL